MEANELRLGNWVESYLPPQISEWIEVEVSPHTLIEMRDHEMKRGFRPIPLTKEWLIKFGFNLNDISGVWDGLDIGCDVEAYRSGFILSINGGEYTQGSEIKYVHQLQNLYFALTGEELTINENN